MNPKQIILIALCTCMIFIITIMILLKENKRLKEERNHTAQALNILTDIFFAKDDNKDVITVGTSNDTPYIKEKYKCVRAMKEMLDMGMSEEQIDEMLFHSLLEMLEQCEIDKKPCL